MPVSYTHLGEETEVLGNTDVRVVRLKHNMRLANALNIGLAHCSYEIVARVDADDISLPRRFAVQVPLVEDGLGLLGSAIQEFSDDEAEAGMVRNMPASEEEIRRVISYRSPFAHPSVVYRKSAVAVSYTHLILTARPSKESAGAADSVEFAFPRPFVLMLFAESWLPKL